MSWGGGEQASEALLVAAEGDDEVEVGRLLAAGADVNIESKVGGEPPPPSL